MQLRDHYPADTAIGACFITGDYSTDDGVIDLDLWLDGLPPFGRLCVSAKAVVMMMSTLGWELPPDNVAEANRRLVEENRALKAANGKLRDALDHALSARAVLEDVS